VDTDASPLGGTEVHYLDSEHVGAEFKIFVGHCGTEGVDAPAVLYLTDANGQFGGTVDVIRLMQLSRHLPPLLVVGIGYRVATIADTLHQRTRDLTPTAWPAYARFEPERTDMGGAPDFLAFIRDELMPWVRGRYGSSPDATYFGHSLGGLFGTYALLRAPDTFTRYVIGSPSLWWHSRAIFDQEAEYAATHDDLAARVFFGIGSDETHEGRAREAAYLDVTEQAKATAIYLDMVDDLQRFVDQLAGRDYPGLRLRHEVFPDEFHITVPFVNLSRGLRWSFDAPT
jgi:predicted alpha/beta superfamily hydrolase